MNLLSISLINPYNKIIENRSGSKLFCILFQKIFSGDLIDNDQHQIEID